MIAQDILPRLKTLRLGGMIHSLELRIKEASNNDMNYMEFLELLLDDEINRRESKRYEQRIKQARIDVGKRYDSFNFRMVPSVPRGDIEMLMTCEYINRGENVLFVGPTGTGKSHLAHSLGNKAVKEGFRVLFRPTHKLLGYLHARRADGGYAKYMRKLQKLDLLILDDFGLVQLTPQNANDLYEIIQERYERKSIIITSNRAAKEWDDIFGNQLMASAALDRLTHHSHYINIDENSFRQLERNGKIPSNGESAGENK
ncbi:MAG: IS21-like element helper ATPase IstB [Thermodesulfobacteriota bacterium]|nr:IS21-like element helper ATPase IstB [Thermodesulfobacteriota bacterium]